MYLHPFSMLLNKDAFLFYQLQLFHILLCLTYFPLCNLVGYNCNLVGLNCKLVKHVKVRVFFAQYIFFSCRLITGSISLVYSFCSVYISEMLSFACYMQLDQVENFFKWRHEVEYMYESLIQTLRRSCQRLHTCALEQHISSACKLLFPIFADVHVQEKK